MNLSDYPTPLTDAARCISFHPQHTMCGWPKGRLGEFDGKHIVTADFARDLERKLAMCRDAMRGMLKTGRVGYSAKNEISKIIEQTK